MKVKEWCIALDNVSSYIDSVLGLRYKFLKGERATKEKVFSMIPSMTEEEYARYFRPATEEEINGEFEWDGEQFILKGSKRMKSIKEKSFELFPEMQTDSDDWDVIEEQCDRDDQRKTYRLGANYVLDIIEQYCKEHIVCNSNINHIIEQLKK